MTSLAARGLSWELIALTSGSGSVRVGDPGELGYVQQERLRELIGAPNPREFAHALNELRDVGLVVMRDGRVWCPHIVSVSRCPPNPR